MLTLTIAVIPVMVFLRSKHFVGRRRLSSRRSVHIEKQNEHKGFLEFCSDWVVKTYRNALKPQDSYEDYGGKRKIKSISRHDFDLKAEQVRKLMQCCQIHQANLKNYYQFFKLFNDCDQYGSEVASFVDKIVQTDDKRYRMRFKTTCNALVDNFLNWSNKVKTLKKEAENSVPVKKRILQQYGLIQCKALCSFDIEGVEIEENEKVVLLDNSDFYIWKVKTRGNVELKVPSIFLGIHGADNVLLKRASKLEEEILASRKKLTNYLESGDGYDSVIDDLYEATNFSQTTSALIETANNKRKPRAVDLQLEERKNSGKTRHFMRRCVELKTRFTDELVEEEISHMAPELSQFSGQQIQMFVITAVVDTSDFSEISLAEAKSRGIVNQKAGTFYNAENGESISIQEAMSLGYIVVERTVVKKERETERKVRAGSQEDLLTH
ncbi:uncharacterized protein LOC141911233 isoform X2 [Tubulanus polymorphus]|uniref:uncharacterized protein LOC141911233 isoform X2 n=1 Tax=Tubulanus polymorphus TaxID=672921 RepID=UPI003DA30764